MTISTIYALHRQTCTKEFDKWLGKASNPKRVLVCSGAKDGGLRSKILEFFILILAGGYTPTLVAS